MCVSMRKIMERASDDNVLAVCAHYFFLQRNGIPEYMLSTNERSEFDAAFEIAHERNLID